MMNLSDVDFNSLSRSEVITLIENKKLTKAALLHWDICNERKTKTVVMVADTLNVSEDLVKWAQRCRCK